MTKYAKKRMTALILAFVVVFAGIASVSMEADAAATYMKKLGVKWGLKEGQTYTFTTQYASIGARNITWTLTDMKKKNAKKKGFKELSFILTYQNDFRPTSAEVDQVMKSEYGSMYSNTGENQWFAIIDASTGLDLEQNNNVKVKVKSKDLSVDVNTYDGTNGAWMKAASLYKVQVTVTYPRDYKNLCIGFGGGNVLSSNKTQADNDFWDGTVPFGKTTYYKKGKTNGRWMMIR